MSKILTLGEPLVVFASEDQDKDLVTAKHFQKFLAGAELNVAVGLTRLGHQVTYLTQVGNDPFGQFIISAMQANQIDASNIKTIDTAWTGFELKEQVSQGDPGVFYYRKNSAASQVTPEMIDALDLSEFDHIHLTGIFAGLSKTTLATAEYCLQKAKAAHIPVTFDPNLRPQLWQSEVEMKTILNRLCAQAEIVMPGIGEGQILMGSDDPETIADYYLNEGVKMVIVKVGSKGAFIKDAAGHQDFVAGFKVKKVIDTVGAGDGFATGVVDGYLRKKPIAEILRQGNAIGAMAVQHQGDSDGYPTAEALADFLQTN
ncbi:sugar kinase [Agrilactobacillus yilanensis]|uniref:Sugar kinase n=1 Tax=Agrilactobacillus yilanensis TaxID=2485997 RepID=A0ABW4JCF7_9LACO|nr:sugar kinase [Agrilactobacillus yilanensis]